MVSLGASRLREGLGRVPNSWLYWEAFSAMLFAVVAFVIRDIDRLKHNEATSLPYALAFVVPWALEKSVGPRTPRGTSRWVLFRVLVTLAAAVLAATSETVSSRVVNLVVVAIFAYYGFRPAAAAKTSAP